MYDRNCRHNKNISCHQRVDNASGNTFSVILCLCAKQSEMKVGAGELRGGGAVCMCFMCLCRLTIYLLQGVLAYSCVAVRCTSPPTPVICLLSVVSRAALERQINGRIDACDYLCGAAWARGSTRGVVSLGTLPLTCVGVYAFVCG